MSPRAIPRIQPSHALAAIVLLGYVSIARVVGNLYPFSTYSMYSHTAHGSPSRIVARDARGGLAEVNTFENWTCDRAPRESDDECLRENHAQYIAYLDREHVEWVVHHPGQGTGGEPVDVVRHTWTLRDGNVATARDCVLARCRATRR